MECLSWIFTVIALLGTILNARMNVAGFFIWIISNLGFVTLNLIEHKYALATNFFVNTIVSISGIYIWNKKRKAKEELTEKQ